MYYTSMIDSKTSEIGQMTTEIKALKQSLTVVSRERDQYQKSWKEQLIVSGNRNREIQKLKVLVNRQEEYQQVKSTIESE